MMVAQKAITEYLKDLEQCDRDGLAERWVDAFGRPPFKGARRLTLIRGLAYHYQSQTLGGIKPSLSKKLLRLSKQNKHVAKPSASNTKIRVGSQIVREWHGRTHKVHVTDKGFVLSGVTYSSLSAAAKAITGTHRSGPRFFGVST